MLLVILHIWIKDVLEIDKKNLNFLIYIFQYQRKGGMQKILEIKRTQCEKTRGQFGIWMLINKQQYRIQKYQIYEVNNRY